MNNALRTAILAYTDTHSGTIGIYRTVSPGLTLIRGNNETPLEHQFYEPALIVVVQGSKETMLGNRRFAYRAGQYLVMSVGLPVQASIRNASDEHPYLALALTIDLAVIIELTRELGRIPTATPVPTRLGLLVGTLDDRQTDVIARLAALLAMPDAMRVLYPSIAREFIYWTLAGRDGAEISRLATPDSHTQRIAEAIGVMRAEYTETVRVGRLAEIAHMSPSAFYHHFKLITSMSPLQYQKQLRLLEARRLMIASGADATRAAYHVGYESASQFSREYARMFGAPPRRDQEALRSAPP